MTLGSYRSPKTEFKDSAIIGKGRFAKEAIGKGEIIAIKSGRIINKQQLQEYSAEIKASQHQISDEFFIAPLSEDEFNESMCYINHSCNPNMGLSGNIIVVALRDIEAGEELCLDYAMLFSGGPSFECRCGEDNCRKTITGEDWKITDLQQRYGNRFSSYLLEKIHNLN
jgi:uncharacterized protein